MTRQRQIEELTDTAQPFTLSYTLPYNMKMVSFKLAFTVRPTTSEDFTVTKDNAANPQQNEVVLLAGDPAIDGIDDFVNTDVFELDYQDVVTLTYPNTDGVEVYAQMIFERT